MPKSPYTAEQRREQAIDRRFNAALEKAFQAINEAKDILYTYEEILGKTHTTIILNKLETIQKKIEAI